jgi:hypothetical protein
MGRDYKPLDHGNYTRAMKSMQCLSAVLAACMFLAMPRAWADAARTAVFPFELVDTSLQGEMQGRAAGDSARLTRLDTQLRDALAQSGKYTPVAAAADLAGPDLRTCGQCATDLARKINAEFSVVGWVQKVSNLILNINIAVYDVATGTRVAGGSVDIRGDTDESWTRGLSFLLRNRILGDGGK